MSSDYHGLQPTVKELIEAIKVGDAPLIQEILRKDPEAANPKWVPGFQPSRAWANVCIPLFYVSEAVFNGTIPVGSNEYAITKTLIDAGADHQCGDGYPLVAAVSDNAIHVVEALLDGGADIDGVDGDGVPMAYAQLFGFTGVVELLAERGARLDVRFASGAGDIARVKDFFNPDGSLKPDAGTLADPFGHGRRRQGLSTIRSQRTRQVILDQAFVFACMHGRLEVAEFLLGQGANINAMTPGFDVTATPLHRVVWFENYGATVDVPAIIEPRRRAMAFFLLARGADLTTRDSLHKRTPEGWDTAGLIGQLFKSREKHGSRK